MTDAGLGPTIPAFPADEAEASGALHRTHRRKLDMQDARKTRARNRVFKDRERARREARMQALIRTAALPYPPAVMSWLSRKLDKPARTITPQDVKALLT